MFIDIFEDGQLIERKIDFLLLGCESLNDVCQQWQVKGSDLRTIWSENVRLFVRHGSSSTWYQKLKICTYPK